jgi:hypothetical protein
MWQCVQYTELTELPFAVSWHQLYEGRSTLKDYLFTISLTLGVVFYKNQSYFRMMRTL